MLLKGVANQVVRGIAKGRDLSKHQVNDIVNNAPWSDRQALKQGLVDNLVYKDEVRTKIRTTFQPVEHFCHWEAYAEHASTPTSSERFQKHAKTMITKDFRIAVINCEGMMTLGDPYSYNPESNVINAHNVRHQLQQVANTKPDAIMMIINSPGGTIMPAEMISRAIYQTRKKIPVVVLMGDACASAGYWAACAADKLIATPSTRTGSIGVFMGTMNTSGFWKDWGVLWYQEHSHKNGRLYSTQTELTEADKTKLNDLVTEGYEDFLDRVADARKISKHRLESIAEGRVWLGTKALKLGLIDGVGGFQQAIHTCLDLQKVKHDDVAIKIDFHQPPMSLKQFIRHSLIGELRIMGAQLWSWCSYKLAGEEL